MGGGTITMRGRVGWAAFLAVALLGASLCAAGCASPTPSAVTFTSTQSPSMTSLYVQRTSIIHRDLPAFETTSTRAAAITTLAATIGQLVFQNRFHAQSTLDDPSCALDDGVDYQLTFFQGQHIALRASFPLGGCARVVLYDEQELGFWNGGGDFVAGDVYLDTFEVQFEAAAGMSASDERNVSPTTHPPYAPPPTFPISLSGYPPHFVATATPTPYTP
jgi:hypothetical protein